MRAGVIRDRRFGATLLSGDASEFVFLSQEPAVLGAEAPEGSFCINPVQPRPIDEFDGG
jgi:hypothetical protein